MRFCPFFDPSRLIGQRFRLADYVWPPRLAFFSRSLNIDREPASSPFLFTPGSCVRYTLFFVVPSFHFTRSLFLKCNSTTQNKPAPAPAPLNSFPRSRVPPTFEAIILIVPPLLFFWILSILVWLQSPAGDPFANMVPPLFFRVLLPLRMVNNHPLAAILSLPVPSPAPFPSLATN